MIYLVLLYMYVATFLKQGSLSNSCDVCMLLKLAADLSNLALSEYCLTSPVSIT
jgi:hypothetical protein